jgi:Ca2+/Na+ antiporter
VIATVFALVVLLAVLVVGHAQAKARSDEPSALRFEAWQLFGLILVPFVVLTHGVLVTRAASVLFVVLLCLVFLVRKRREGARVDDF